MEYIVGILRVISNTKDQRKTLCFTQRKQKKNVLLKQVALLKQVFQQRIALLKLVFQQRNSGVAATGNF